MFQSAPTPLAAGTATNPIPTDGGFGTPHGAGPNNFLVGDGAVRVVANLTGLDWETKRRLGVRKDGLTVEVP